MKQIIPIIMLGVVVGIVASLLGIGLMPGSKENDAECRRRHIIHGVWTGIAFAAFWIIYQCIHNV